MFLMNNGDLYAFGYGVHGQLGIPVVKNLHTPQQVKKFCQNEFIT